MVGVNPAPRLLREVLREVTVRDNRWDPKNISRQTLSNRTTEFGHNVPVATIAKYETQPGLVPPADVLEVLAKALGLKPEQFYEYPVAVAARDAKLRQSEIPEDVAEEAAREAGQPHEARLPADAPSDPKRKGKDWAA